MAAVALVAYTKALASGSGALAMPVRFAASVSALASSVAVLVLVQSLGELPASDMAVARSVDTSDTAQDAPMGPRPTETPGLAFAAVAENLAAATSAENLAVAATRVSS